MQAWPQTGSSKNSLSCFLALGVNQTRVRSFARLPIWSTCIGRRMPTSCRSFSNSFCCSRRTPFLTSSMMLSEGTTFLRRSLTSASSTSSERAKPPLPLGRLALHLRPAWIGPRRLVLLGLPFVVPSVGSYRGGVPTQRLVDTFQNRKPELAEEDRDDEEV